MYSLLGRIKLFLKEGYGLESAGPFQGFPVGRG
jgi:hypothetical protein